MAKRIEVSISISTSPPQAYSYIVNFDNFSHWTDAVSVEKVFGSGEVGSTYDIVTHTILGTRKTLIEITQRSAHMVFAFKDTSMSVDNETGFKIKEEENGHITVTAYQELGIGAIISLLSLNFLTARDVERRLSQMLKNLKLTLET